MNTQLGIKIKMKEPKPTEFNWNDTVDINDAQKLIKDAVERDWENYKDKLWLIPVAIFATKDLTDEQKRELANELLNKEKKQ